MNKERAMLKAVMLDEKGGERDPHVELVGCDRDILNLLTDIVDDLIGWGVDPMCIVKAVFAGIKKSKEMGEKENGKCNNI